MSNYLVPQASRLVEFVKYWSEAYDKTYDKRYFDNIESEITGEKLLELFVWKNGGKLSKRKEQSVREKYIPRIKDLKSEPSNTTPEVWLRKFGSGGAIWNIFFLHIWNQKYPIFDQHVYRAMKFIQAEEIRELPTSKAIKTKIYLEEYWPFYRKLHANLGSNEDRNLDRALWKFGQFLKWLEPPAEDEDEN